MVRVECWCGVDKEGGRKGSWLITRRDEVGLRYRGLDS